MLETIDRTASQAISQPEASLATRSFWEAVAEIGAQIPDEEWTKIPADASLNPDRYLYNTPQQSK